MKPSSASVGEKEAQSEESEAVFNKGWRRIDMRIMDQLESSVAVTNG